MSLRQKYLTILTTLAPAGAVGASLMLGAATPVAASEHSAGTQPTLGENEKVSERLAAVREAVTAVASEREAGAKAEGLLAWGNWGWGGGWGWPNWNNWRNFRNWNNYWHNW